MNGATHFLSKIERNANVIDKASGDMKKDCLQHVIWARELSKRLDSMDYDQRQEAIRKIHEVMDGDYTLMGYKIEDPEKGSTKSF